MGPAIALPARATKARSRDVDFIGCVGLRVDWIKIREAAHLNGH